MWCCCMPVPGYIKRHEGDSVGEGDSVRRACNGGQVGGRAAYRGGFVAGTSSEDERGRPEESTAASPLFQDPVDLTPNVIQISKNSRVARQFRIQRRRAQIFVDAGAATRRTYGQHQSNMPCTKLPRPTHTGERQAAVA